MKTLVLKNNFQIICDHGDAQRRCSILNMTEKKKVYFYKLSVRIRHIMIYKAVRQHCHIHLNNTENDVLRAFRYWESVGLLRLGHGPDGGITAVEFLRDEEENTCGDTTDFSGCTSSYPQDSIPAQTPVAPVTEFRSEAVSAPVESNIQTPVSNAVPLDTFRAQKEIKSLLFITEQYLGKTLTHTDVDTITYFYDTLHMSADLIEYLIESCVENGHKSMHYIQKVAISWVENGVETVSQAKNRLLHTAVTATRF